ncbi:hypothetical protein [Rhizobium sp. LjRoot254]|uniref:hypothetical protein n=1 Tax=Rhizobium sp. LjRoot254 TaxID=3342297 RepID=UPI003ECCE241
MAFRNKINKPTHASTPEEESAPLVDEALDAVNNREREAAEQAFEATSDEELSAIGAEIERIKESIALITQASSHYVKRRVAENSTDMIAENPVRAALWAAFIGFCIGRLSR